MSLSDEERTALVNYRLEKSAATMEQVKTLIPFGYWDLIANRLYYAAYYTVSALLLQQGHSVQTHHGIIHLLGLHYIKPGKLDKRHGTTYGRLFSLRQTGDYGDLFGLTESDVMPLVPDTEALISTVSEIIRSQQK